MSKLLIVSWGVYPLTTGSSIIVNNIVAEFTKDEVVVFGEYSNRTNKNVLPENHPTIYYTNPNVNIRGRGQIHFRWINFFKVVKEIKEIIIKENCTKILCVFPDDFYLFAAYLASKSLNIPLFTWFHNTYLDNYTGYRKLFAQWFQPIIFKYAVNTFVMSEGMSDYYNAKYPDTSFAILRHGFPLPIHDFEPFGIQKQKVRFVFTGSLNESCRDATVRLIATISKNPDYEVYIYTGSPISEFEKFNLIKQNVIFKGFVILTDLEFYQELLNYDIMLLPHGFDGDRTDEEIKTIFPTRTIPLLLSNRPILAHSPPNTFFTNFLIKHDCAYIVDSKSEEAIFEAIQIIINDRKLLEKRVKNALETAKLFDIKTITKQIKKAIEI